MEAQVPGVAPCAETRLHFIAWHGWATSDAMSRDEDHLKPGVQCICATFDTVLGVFTIIVLMRESVKQLFAVNKSPATTVGAPGS